MIQTIEGQSMKRQRNFIVLLSVIFICLSILSPLTLASDKNGASLNKTMVGIGHTMEGLFPLMFDKNDINKEQKHKIQEGVDTLITLFENAKPHINKKSPTYGISFRVIKNQLGNAKAAVKHNNHAYAKSILKDITTVCASCHTQDMKTRTLFPNVKRDFFDSDLEYAEFSYITRQYDSAIDYFDRHLKSKETIDEADMLSIMKQIMTIYIQINYRPDDALKRLSAIKENKHHTKFTRKTLDEWIKGIKDLKKDPNTQKPVAKFKTLELEVHKILGDLHEAGSANYPNKRERISRLWLRGSLYHYLNTSPPASEIPMILYWLAIVDNSINFSIYYSLSDMYLKECMLKYTKHPYAKKCFDEYKENIILSYSGSRGTDVPEDIKQELKALQIRIEGVSN